MSRHIPVKNIFVKPSYYVKLSYDIVLQGFFFKFKFKYVEL
jgi:hypothetical protein